MTLLFPKSDTPVLPLLSVVFTSILEVFLLCLAGYILASRGILDKKTQKQINRLNVSLFTPCLLFSKVAFFLSPEKLKELWIIPIFFVLVTTVSMSISYLLATIFRLKRSQRSFAMAASMFMNSNSLPIALMQSLVVTVPELKWDADDNKNAMLGRALSYLVLYSTLGMVLRWSYGVRLLAAADLEVAKQITINEPLETTALPDEDSTINERNHLISPNGSPPQITVTDPVQNGHSSGVAQTLKAPPPPLGQPAPVRRLSSGFYKSFPNSPNSPNAGTLNLIPEVSSPAKTSRGASTSTLPLGESDLSSSDDDGNSSDDEVLPSTHPILPSSRRLRRQRELKLSATLPQRLTRLPHIPHFGPIKTLFVGFTEFMTPPLYSALLSIIVACTPPLQHALENHMQPVKGFLSQAGGCSIPVTLIILGAYFYVPPPEGEEAVNPPNDKKKRKASAEDRRILNASNASSFTASLNDMFKMSTISSTTDQVKKDEKRPGETLTVIIAVLSRMILTPLVLFPLMAMSTKWGLHEIFDDPVFVVANVLLIASPPALTLAQITQVASGDAFERLISRTIFWSYCVITPPAAIVNVVLGLLLSKL